MKTFKLYYLFALLGLVFVSCENDDDEEPMMETVVPVAGTLSGGPFEFRVDGTPDMVSGISLDGSQAMGTNRTFVITDDMGGILGLPPDMAALEGVNFDGAGVGLCLIWYLRYEDGLTGLEMGGNANTLQGSFDLSNSIEVLRLPSGGEIAGGPFEFSVDGMDDFVSGIMLDDATLSGSEQSYVVTDDERNILGLPPTIEALEGVNFDGAGTGVCFIYHISYEPGLTGLEGGNNLDDLQGFFGLSNRIDVTRLPNAGTISGGPFTFMVDGNPDMVSGINLDATGLSGSQQTYVITDENRNILGLPPTIEALEGVDFDGAGTGVCFIYHMSYEMGVTGLEAGTNLDDLEGLFGLSNRITVTRN